MLHIHRSHRTEALVERLATVLSQPLDDPMQPEHLLVGSRGMERWLAAELAQHSARDGGPGVLANVQVDFPQRFVDRLTEDVLGPRDRDEVDPWSTDALVWTLAGRLPDAIAAEPDAFATIAGYLDIEPRDSAEPVDDAGQLAFPVDTEAVARGKVVDRKLLGFAGQTADLFDRYALYRPDMVRAWQRKRDVDATGDPLGRQRWQAVLWRTVAAEQAAAQSPADRIAAATRALSRGQDLGADVPDRLLAFGVSTLPPLQLELLAAVATQRDVHLFVPSPSPRLWQLGWDGDTDGRPDNALLRAAGPVGRHAAVLVREAASAAGATTTGVDPGEELPTAGPGPDTSLLARLQHDVATDTPLPERTEEWLADDTADRSVVFHDGHGAVRQVEALKDELLRRFDADHTLHPRDVVVLTPDLPTYAPLVEAVFADSLGGPADGRTHGGEPPTIPVAVADRTAGRGNPIAAVLTRMLALAHARTSGAEVLDLLSTEPVRARFRITPGELVTVQQWIEDTGVAWARDEADREHHGEPARREHTWAAAVDRLLVGVAMADERARTVGGVVPYDAVEDRQDLDLLDRLTRFLDIVLRLRDLRVPRFPSDWADTLGAFLDRLTGPADGLPGQDEAARNAHRRHRDRVDRVLGQLALAEETVARPIETRALARWLDRTLDAVGGSAGHGTGQVTVAELVPLRAIPFRVVCLLGMDTGRFPRSATPPGHDLVARDPRPGDRDRRAEDRALFLDAIHAAQDALVVTYAGRDPVSGRQQPPAIPVAELRDAVAAYIGKDGLWQRTTVHPVLPTGTDAFDADRGPTSFDQVRLAAARASQHRQDEPPAFVPVDLGDDPDRPEADVVSLGDLARVLAKPAQALLYRLRIARPEDLRTFPETEPLELDNLEKWKLGTALLDQLEEAAGDITFDDLLDVTLRRGRVPAGAVGRHEVRGVRLVVERMAELLAGLGDRAPVAVAADVGDTRIEGKVRVARDDGGTNVVETWYGRADGKRFLRAWLRHLTACIELVDDEPRTVILHREGQVDVEVTVYPYVQPDTARRELQRWLDTYRACRRTRVPFVAKVSWIYAQARREAERLAATAEGADLAEVEGLTDDELRDRFGDVAQGRDTVAKVLDRGLGRAHGKWGRGENDFFPVREEDAVRLVFRDCHRWEHLVARTDLLELSRDLLRPLADAIVAGEDAAAALQATGVPA